MRLLFLLSVAATLFAQSQPVLQCGSAVDGTLTLENQSPAFTVFAQDNDRIAIRLTSAVTGASRPIVLLVNGDTSTLR